MSDLEPKEVMPSEGLQRERTATSQRNSAVTGDQPSGERVGVVAETERERAARQLPAVEKRVETGPIQFGDDWPGLFIRGDNCFGIMSQLSIPPFREIAVKTVFELLRTPIIGNVKDKLQLAASETAALRQQLDTWVSSYGKRGVELVNDGWQLAHDPASCGHPRACWLDRNWPESEKNYNPETRSGTPEIDTRCIMCEKESELAALRQRVEELEPNSLMIPQDPAHAYRVGFADAIREARRVLEGSEKSG